MTFEPPDGSNNPYPGLSADGGTGEWEDVPPWWLDERGYGGGDDWAPFPRRRHSRVLQVTGIVVAAALILASAGTTIEVVLGRSSSDQVGPQVTSVLVLPVDPVIDGGATTPVRVTFEVLNDSRRSVIPVCTVSVVDAESVVATAHVGPPELGSIALGKRTFNNTVVPVPTSALSGPAPSAQIVCHS